MGLRRGRAPTIWRSPAPASGRARPGWARTGRGCPTPRRRDAKSRSRSTTAPIPRSRRRSSTCSMRPACSATFFCIARTACGAPGPLLARSFARGHSVQNHSDRASKAFSLLGPRGDRRRDPCRAGVARRHHRRRRRASSARRPACATPSSRRCCTASSLQLVSWTRRGFDTVRREPDVLVQRLGRGLAAGDILLLHDGNAARTTSGQPLILAVLPALLSRIAARRPAPRDAAGGRPQRATPHERCIDGGRCGPSLRRRGERAVPASRPLRLALRARQAALGPGVRAPRRARPDRAGRARARHRLRPGPARQPARCGRRRRARRALVERLGRGADGCARTPASSSWRATSSAPAMRSATAPSSSAPTCARAAFPRADAVVILDVLHYVERRRAGRRARRACARRSPAAAA